MGYYQIKGKMGEKVKKELYIGFVRSKPYFIFHFHKGWWWIRICGLQIEVIDKRLTPYMPWVKK